MDRRSVCWARVVRRERPSNYAPGRGDVVWMQFGPGAGHEQGGHRPALVLSPRDYNARTGLLVCCPITSKRKDYPFEVVVEADAVRGVVLADQVRSVDWKHREARLAGAAVGAADRVARIVGRLIEA
ncbi:MAG: endoribonuclease MazF [Vulcanimicrobiaceae bacterium]